MATSPEIRVVAKTLGFCIFCFLEVFSFFFGGFRTLLDSFCWRGSEQRREEYMRNCGSGGSPSVQNPQSTTSLLDVIRLNIPKKKSLRKHLASK